jgi:hypothetical protein
MAIFNCMYPVLPGKEDVARSFAKELSGPRLDQFNAQQARGGVTRETWTVQQTPTGAVILVWFDGDIDKAFADIATDESEFATWFRAQVLEISGFDLAAPDDGPLPEVVLEWTA